MLIVSFLIYVSLVLAAPIPARYSRMPTRRAVNRIRKMCRVPPSATSSLTSATASASPVTKNTDTSSVVKLLFPEIQGTKGRWSTSPDAEDSLPLSDVTFRPLHKSGHPYSYENAPDGKLSLKANYPKGSYKPSASIQGGFSFYALGPPNVDLTTAKEAIFAYSVMFPEGFEWVKGGKLPGFYGGDSDDESVSCSGGRRDTGCFSARMMWRPDGRGELYTYLPPGLEGNANFCSEATSECNPTYGASIGRGNFAFKSGEWTTMSQRLKLNDPGQANGEIELFVGGESKINVTGITIRQNDNGRIRGIQMQTFFGGSEPDWASPKDQDVYFADFSVGIVSTL